MHYRQGSRAAAIKFGLIKQADDWDWQDYLTGGALAAVGAPLAYKGLRRFRPSDNPALRALQEQAKDLPFEMTTSAPTNSMKGRALRRFLYGAPDISDAVAAAGKARDTLQRDATVLHHGSPFGRLPVQGKLNLNDPRQGVAPAMADKGSFAKVMKQVQEQLPEGTKAIPETEAMGDVLRAFQGNPEAMQRHLKGGLPGGWLIKPTDESLGQLSSFVNESTPLTDKRWERIQRNPGGFILQEKLPLKNEYRVHTIQGVPFSATHRRAPEGKFRNWWNQVSQRLGIGQGGFAHIPVDSGMERKLHEYVSTVNKPLADTYKNAPLHQAFDVAELGDGTFRMIESNPTPGTYTNPILSRRLQELVTGRRHQDYAAAGALGAGGLAGYGGSEISSRFRSKEKKNKNK